MALIDFDYSELHLLWVALCDECILMKKMKNQAVLPEFERLRDKVGKVWQKEEDEAIKRYKGIRSSAA